MAYESDIKDRTKKFAIRVIKLCTELKKYKLSFDIIDQLQRSGTSVGANVREAKASSTKKELIRFYEIALRSANETDYWMEVIQEGYSIEEKIFEADKKELVEISRIIGKIIVNLKNSN